MAAAPKVTAAAAAAPKAAVASYRYPMRGASGGDGGGGAASLVTMRVKTPSTLAEKFAPPGALHMLQQDATAGAAAAVLPEAA